MNNFWDAMFQLHNRRTNGAFQPGRPPQRPASPLKNPAHSTSVRVDFPHQANIYPKTREQWRWNWLIGTFEGWVSLLYWSGQAREAPDASQNLVRRRDPDPPQPQLRTSVGWKLLISAGFRGVAMLFRQLYQLKSRAEDWSNVTFGPPCS